MTAADHANTPSALAKKLREAIDTLAIDHADYDKCRLCPLGEDSVCFPNCAAWKSAVAALDALVAQAEERVGGGDDYRLRMVSEARERMHAAEDRAEAAEADSTRLREALAMLWDHYLLRITDEQKAQVRAALSVDRTEAHPPDPDPNLERTVELS